MNEEPLGLAEAFIALKEATVKRGEVVKVKGWPYKVTQVGSKHLTLRRLNQ